MSGCDSEVFCASSGLRAAAAVGAGTAVAPAGFEAATVRQSGSLVWWLRKSGREGTHVQGRVRACVCLHMCACARVLEKLVGSAGLSDMSLVAKKIGQ